MILYHNPRCSKSREALQWLNEQNLSPQIRLYLDTGLTAPEIQHLAQQLNAGSLRDFMRHKEDDYLTQNLQTADETTLLNALIATPKLLERPILVTEHGAAIGRPLQNIIDLVQAG